MSATINASQVQPQSEPMEKSSSVVPETNNKDLNDNFNKADLSKAGLIQSQMQPQNEVPKVQAEDASTSDVTKQLLKQDQKEDLSGAGFTVLNESEAIDIETF